jgi:hypothetical protein
VKAILVWHHYTMGKPTGYSITEFEGNVQQLVACAKEKKREEGTIRQGVSPIILHQIVILG